MPAYQVRSAPTPQCDDNSRPEFTAFSRTQRRPVCLFRTCCTGQYPPCSIGQLFKPLRVSGASEEVLNGLQREKSSGGGGHHCSNTLIKIKLKINTTRRRRGPRGRVAKGMRAGLIANSPKVWSVQAKEGQREGGEGSREGGGAGVVIALVGSQR